MCHPLMTDFSLSFSACNSSVLNPRTILVKMISQAGTGYSFNTKRSRLREKLTLLHYDPVGKIQRGCSTINSNAFQTDAEYLAVLWSF